MCINVLRDDQRELATAWLRAKQALKQDLTIRGSSCAVLQRSNNTNLIGADLHCYIRVRYSSQSTYRFEARRKMGGLQSHCKNTDFTYSKEQFGPSRKV